MSANGTKQVMVRLTESQLTLLQQAAGREHRKQSQMARVAIMRGLADLMPAPVKASGPPASYWAA